MGAVSIEYNAYEVLKLDKKNFLPKNKKVSIEYNAYEVLKHKFSGGTATTLRSRSNIMPMRY